MTDLDKIYEENGGPRFETTEEINVVKNIFNEEDEAMFAHLMKKCMGLRDEDRLPDGMIETPHRVAKAWTEHFSGYREDPKQHLKKTFDVSRAEDLNSEGEQYMEFKNGIVVCKCKAFSHCEHHVAVMGTFLPDSWIYVAYIPDQKVVGLSKIPRMVRGFGHRFQIQEQWSENVADAMMEMLKPKGVYVYMKDISHCCVLTRGVKSEDATTSSSVLRGCFCHDDQARIEALNLMK